MNMVMNAFFYNEEEEAKVITSRVTAYFHMHYVETFGLMDHI